MPQEGSTAIYVQNVKNYINKFLKRCTWFLEAVETFCGFGDTKKKKYFLEESQKEKVAHFDLFVAKEKSSIFKGISSLPCILTSVTSSLLY